MPATTSVPHKVASGMFRWGFSTLPAGTVADSKPRKAHNVRIAEAFTEASENGVDSISITEASAVISSHTPSRMMAANGSSFSTVVTICSPPDWRVPRQFT